MSTILLTRREPKIFISERKQRLISVPNGPRGAKGDPGGNVMAIGLFADASGLTIPAGTDMVRTSGHSVLGLGGAYYVHDAAVDAAYVTANPLSSFRDTAGRGFKLVVPGYIDVTWLGAKLDNVTNDSAAIVAAVALSNALKVANNSTTRPGFGNGGGPAVYMPGFAYMGSTTLTLAHVFRLYGDTRGIPGSIVSGMRWDEGVTGIENPARAAIEGLALVSAFTGTEGEHHAIHATQVFPYRNLVIWNWPGDGMNLDDAGSGNVNGVVGENVWCSGCRDALNNNTGGDGNAQAHHNWNIGSCRRWGIAELGFLGNSHYSHEVADCGITSWNDGVNIGASVVSQGGNRYFAIAGQEAGASTNAPSGTTADNTWWAYLSAGGAATGVPAWSSGILVRAGGSYRTNDVNAQHLFAGCYHEGGQGRPQLVSPSFAVGGNMAANVYGNPGVGGAKGRGLSVNLGAVLSPVFRAGRDGNFYTQLGDDDPNAAGLLSYNNTDVDSNVYRLKLSGKDFWWNYANGGGANVAFRITGASTTQQFGTGVAVPHCLNSANLRIGDTGNARLLTTGFSAPSSGNFAQGDVIFKIGMGAGGSPAWGCTTAGVGGSTAVFKTFANMAA